MSAEPRMTVAALIDIWNGAPVEGLRDLLSADYRGHMLHLNGGQRDATAYPRSIEQFRASTPGTSFRIVEHITAKDRLVTRLEAGRASEPSGQRWISQGINISRFDSEGRLAEEWAIWSPWFEERD